jgi:hypothetical protein
MGTIRAPLTGLDPKQTLREIISHLTERANVTRSKLTGVQVPDQELSDEEDLKARLAALETKVATAKYILSQFEKGNLGISYITEDREHGDFAVVIEDPSLSVEVPKALSSRVQGIPRIGGKQVARVPKTPGGYIFGNPELVPKSRRTSISPEGVHKTTSESGFAAAKPTKYSDAVRPQRTAA